MTDFPKRKPVYTTGEVTRIALVSINTVIRACNAGELKCFKVPGSDHRRVPRVYLIRWMLKNEIPLDGLGELDDDDKRTIAHHHDSGGV